MTMLGLDAFVYWAECKQSYAFICHKEIECVGHCDLYHDALF